MITGQQLDHRSVTDVRRYVILSEHRRISRNAPDQHVSLVQFTQGRLDILMLYPIIGRNKPNHALNWLHLIKS